MIKVALVDDQTLVRLGLKVLLETEDDMTLVGEAENGADAVDMVRRTRPDVVLMDVRMPVMDGIEALRAIVASSDLARTKVVMLTTFELDEYVFDALRAGASGFLIKDTEPGELLRAIRVVARGESLLSPTVTRRLIDRFVARSSRSWTPNPDVATLTEREREVVALVAEGLSNDQIAERLIMSPATARTHVSRAMMKLDARDRAQLVVIAYQSGLAASDA
jgi:DNA-binding NarL/FixJ family response regulator